MSSLSRIILFLTLAGLLSAEEIRSSAVAFQHTQSETPDFSEVVKELKLEPLIPSNSKNVVRVIWGGGWFDQVLTIHIPAVGQQPAVAELKLASFDATGDQTGTETLRADLTPNESVDLHAALSLGKSFNRSQPDHFIHAIDSGWSFVEMQTATEYKCLFQCGSANAHSDNKKLETVLLHIMTRILTEKTGESASPPNAGK